MWSKGLHMNNSAITTIGLINFLNHVKGVNRAMSKQREKLLEFEEAMGIGPVEAARLLNTPYPTLRDWKGERNAMPGAAYVAIDLLILNKKMSEFRNE